MRDGFKLAKALILDSTRLAEVSVQRAKDQPCVAADGRETLGKEMHF